MNKLSKMAIIAVSGLLFLTGCSEANRVSENLSTESDNFNVVRKVTVIVLCLQLGYDVEECLTIAYNDIKDRKGVMIDDNFVKTKTRQPANNSNDSTTGITGN